MPSQSFCVFCQRHWDTPRIRFFHVPKDEERRRAWNDICGLELTECFKICEQHFKRNEDIIFSKNFKRYRLLKTAIPSKELINIVQETGWQEGQASNTQRKRKRKDMAKLFKDAETQTRCDTQMIACGSVQVTKDYRIFSLICAYCKTTFTLWNYAAYIQHIKAKHRYEEEESCLEQRAPGQMQDLNLGNCMTADEIDVEEYVIGDSIEVDDSAEFIEYDPAGDEHNATLHDENAAEMERLKELLAKNNVIVKKFGVEEPVEEYIDVGNAEVDENMQQVKENTQLVSQKLQMSDDLLDEINVYSSDEMLVWAFIEQLKTYPILWHPPPQKLPENYLLTMLAFCKVFNEQYRLAITNTGMRNSIENLQQWYRECYQNYNWESLTYPQNEYFHKCTAFLSDKADGAKTCEICEHVAIDYLQYILHKKNFHEISLSVSCLPSEQVETYLRTRWYRVLNLECQLCTNKYKYINAFVIHMKAHADVREFICDLCGAAFVRLEGLNVHRRRHTGPIQRICKICNKGFNDFQLLSMHRRRYHRPIEGTIEEIEENLKSRRKTMTRRAVQSTKYTTRIDPKTNKRFYICHFCDKEYHQYSGLHKHFRLWHKNEWVPSGRVGRPKAVAQFSTNDSQEETIMLQEDEEYAEEYEMKAEEVEIEHIYAEEEAEIYGEEEEVEEAEEEMVENDECKIEFEFDMEPAEEIEIQ